jgi:hypothetical protein
VLPLPPGKNSFAVKIIIIIIIIKDNRHSHITDRKINMFLNEAFFNNKKKYNFYRKTGSKETIRKTWIQMGE